MTAQTAIITMLPLTFVMAGVITLILLVLWDGDNMP